MNIERLVRKAALEASTARSRVEDYRETLIRQATAISLVDVSAVYSNQPFTPGLTTRLEKATTEYNVAIRYLFELLEADFEELAPALLDNPWSAPISKEA